ncbi:MAG: transketolase [Acholeplasmatales bacterium]|jgi:transketolase|nr:transketolase [Acholeplasmatales bacterium]
MKVKELNKLCINAASFLGIDMINSASSGHPGIVLGSAPILYTLFTKHLNVYPGEPKFINRDRFVLSAGHGSALLYSFLYLSGFQLTIDDLKHFRSFGITPGHPEVGTTPGVEATTGPLGQGIGNGVGLAIAQTVLAQKFNKNGFSIFDNYTYVLCGDGDLQEGVAHEAISLAGHLKLSKLILLYDSNKIQLDGKTDLATSENIQLKFKACGWNYHLVDSETESISRAISLAKKSENGPTIIECRTVIGRGSLVENTSKVHGAPLDKDDIIQLKTKNNYSLEPFYVPKEVLAHFHKTIFQKGRNIYMAHKQLLNEYQTMYPDDYKLLISFFNDNQILVNRTDFKELLDLTKNSTRNVIGSVINKYSTLNLNLIGGSADLTSSTKAKGNDGHYSSDHLSGRNINFGVREHAMGTITNGILLFGGLRTFTGTFFSFSDYMKPAIRVAAISHLPNIFIFTHDTIAVGEDGPTHQPIEQLTSLRSIPNVNVLRPCDTKETIGAYEIASLSKNTPTVIVLTRQDLPNLEQSNFDVSRGAYIIDREDESKKIDFILLSCGSEITLCLEAKKILASKFNIRIVSMPSTFLFNKQSDEFKNSILPNRNITVAVEMGTTEIWYRYASHVYGIERFGESASLNLVLDKFGFTKEKLANYLINL